MINSFFVQCMLDTRRFLFVFCLGREGDVLLPAIVIGLKIVCGHYKVVLMFLILVFPFSTLSGPFTRDVHMIISCILYVGLSPLG